MLEALQYIQSEPFREWLSTHEDLLTSEQICRLIMEGHADIEERYDMLLRYAAQNHNPQDSSMIAACIVDMEDAQIETRDRTPGRQFLSHSFSHVQDHWRKNAIFSYSWTYTDLCELIEHIRAEIDPEEIGIPPAKEADPEELHSKGESYDNLKVDWYRAIRYDLHDSRLEKTISFLLDHDGNILQYRWEDDLCPLFEEPFWLPSFAETGMLMTVEASPIFPKEYIVALGSGHPWCLYFQTRRQLGVRRLGSLYTADRDDTGVLPSPYLCLAPCEEKPEGPDAVLYEISQTIQKNPEAAETILAYFKEQKYAEPKQLLELIHNQEVQV